MLKTGFCAMYALLDGGVEPLLLQMAAFVASAGLVASTDFQERQMRCFAKSVLLGSGAA